MLNPQLSHSNSLDISNLEYNLITTQSEPYLNMEISIEEVSEVIYSLDDNKSPGPDGLVTSTIKNPIAIEYLHKLYNFSFKNSEIPSDWYLSSLVPIYKGNGSKHDPNNYRGIAIQPCIVKGFCKILNNRLTTYLDYNNILCEEQCGFRKKRSCQDQIFTLFNILENRKLCKKDTYTCFVGFKKAFDSIPRDKLWQCHVCKLM